MAGLSAMALISVNKSIFVLSEDAEGDDCLERVQNLLRENEREFPSGPAVCLGIQG